MRRFGVLAMVLVALPFGGSDRPLPLHSESAATARLTAVVGDKEGSILAIVDPATLASVRRSERVGWYDGWVRSPDGRLLAIATHTDANPGYVSTIRFANSATLHWVRQGVRLHGIFRGAVWARENRLFALTGDCCNADVFLESVDTVAKRVVATRQLDGTIGTIARAHDALVLLGEDVNTVAPPWLEVIGSDGSVRSVTLDRIRAGWHYDQTSQDPIGTVRQPGLAVDASDGVAYVVDADGLVAEIRLDDLPVTYHRLGDSLFARLGAWLQPQAQAKGENGPTRQALWLGEGLIAITGADSSAVTNADGSDAFASDPAGLRVIDTHDWSVRTIDPQADTAFVADGVLLTSGGTWRNDALGEVTTGEGVAAWNPDGSLRWRYSPGTRVSVLEAYGTRAIVLADSARELPKVLNLATGHVVRTLSGAASPWLLLGVGS